MVKYLSNINLGGLDVTGGGDKGTFIKVYNAKEYSAAGNGKIVNDGAMTSATATLTSSTASFSSSDVGKVISVNGAGASGVPLTTTILSFGSSTSVTLNASASTTVSSARVVYGTDDTSAIQACHDAMPSSSGAKMYIPAGVYCITGNISITKSNLDIELNPNAYVIAVARTDSSFKSEYRGMFYLRNSSAGATQKNVNIHGGTIDSNYQVETSSLAVWGSGTSSSVVGTRGIRVQQVTFCNKGNSTNSPALVQIHSVTDLTLGRIQEFKLWDCTFDTSDLEAFRLRGTYIDNVTCDTCEFKNIAIHTINLTSGSEVAPVPSNSFSNFWIKDSYFHDNMTVDQSQTVWDIGTSSRCGVKNFIIRGNSFDGTNEFKDNDNPHIQVYSCEGIIIDGNTFKDTRQALSLGYSNNGTPFDTSPNRAINITNNNFIRVHGTLTDYDQNVSGFWRNNLFYKCGLNVGQGYAGHAFDGFDYNKLIDMNHDIGNDTLLGSYNTGKTTAGLTPQEKSCIAIEGQNLFSLVGNLFVDTRKLTDPSSTSSTSVTAIAGGALSSRTYYYRYAYRNVSGTTLASTSTSIAIGASQLIKVAPTGSPNNARTTDSTTTPIGISGIEYIDIYVGTVSGSETLQASIPFPDFNAQGTGWTEPTSGLITGGALPSSNTTHALTTYGIYETTATGGYLGPNVISDNKFYGISTANSIFSTDTVATRTIRKNNVYIPDLTGVSYDDEGYIYDQGSLTGSPVFNHWLGRTIRFTLGGNLTPTFTAGFTVGERLTLICVQDATGNRTITWPSNVKLTGGSITLSTAANAVDTIPLYWDGTNWRELTRPLASLTIPDADATTKGKIQLAGDLGGTAASPTTPTAVHLTGAETITGLKTTSGTSSYNLNSDSRWLTSTTLVDQTATLTSNAGPNGMALASNEANSSNAAWNAFDKNNSTKWTAAAVTGKLRYDFGVGKIITQYAITGPVSGQSTMAPKTWTFEGSYDGSSWTVLDTQTNAAAWSAIEQRTFTFTNQRAYRTYRLNITANEGSGSNLSIVELRLYAAAITASVDLDGVGTFSSVNPFAVVDSGGYSINVLSKGAVGDGTTDDTYAFQAAHDSLPANGGKIYVPAKTFILNNSFIVSKSNVELELAPGAIIRAGSGTASLSLGSGQPGLIHIYNSAGTQQNVTVRGGIIDTNNVSEVNHVSVWGGGTDTTAVGLTNIRFIDVQFTNKGNSTSTSAMVRAISGASDVGNPAVGQINDIKFFGCTFDTSDKNHIRIEGGVVKNFVATRNRFLNAITGNIVFNQPSFSSATSSHVRSNKNFEISHNYFNNGTNFTSSWIYDTNKTGQRAIKVIGNFFDGAYTGTPPTTPSTGVYAFCVDIEGGSWGVLIKDNTFWKCFKAVSIGESNNGPWFQTNPVNMHELSGNVFYKVYQTFDHDSDVSADIHDNRFVECLEAPYSALYGRHYNSMFHDNIIYDCNATGDGSTLGSSAAAIAIGPTGQRIYNNTIVDDRALANPTTAPVLTTVAGGSLGARTYFVKYTWENDTGETMASSESTTAVGASNLLKITHPYSATYGPPPGAKKINWYVSTSTGTETKQATNLLIWGQEELSASAGQSPETWTEPTTGLIAGSSLPGSNTTKRLTLAGIYEISGATMIQANVYEGNRFFGLTNNEIYSTSTSYKRVQHNNITVRNNALDTVPQVLERIPYAIGNITGATTFQIWNGEVQTATFTGNVTATIPNGHYVGQMLERRFIMGGSGSYTYTKASNEVLAGSAYSPSATVGAQDVLVQEWDGTNWIEKSRILGVAVGGGSASWGSITGTLSSQTDLQTALNAKPTKGYAIAMAIAL